MQIEIINTGSELMLGFILNTHQQWLCRQLTDLGYAVARQTAVPDSNAAIEQAVRESLARADLVIVTGGLGPTSDDLTRDRIAELTGCPLREDPATVARIEQFFAGRNRLMPLRARVQALIPEGALVFPNAHGTAPGLLLTVAAGRFRASTQPSWLVMLPGPPRELRPMFSEQVVPWLRETFPPPDAFACRVLRAIGLGESLVEDKIAPSLATLTEAGLEIGYCAHVGQVDVRLAARGTEAKAVVAEAEQIVRALLMDFIFGADEEALEQVVIQQLTQRGCTLAVAESCTGGLIAHRLTNVPGASAVFLAGFVTYCNDAKQRFLNVRPETLERHGAVSEPTAREMAEGARSAGSADYAIAVTGIAGPTGGTPQKPLGTVFIAVADGQKTRVVRNSNPYDRETFKFVTSQQALDVLRRTLLASAEK